MAGLDAETRKMILETLEDFAQKNLPLGFLLELDRNNVFPSEIIKKMHDPAIFGVHLFLIAEEYGGMGAGSYDIYRLCEALARIDLGLATTIFATFLGIDPIKVGGTAEQKTRWLGRIASEGLLVAYGATEPEAGSDLAALKTRAIPVERDGAVAGYRISGRKQWISNGGVADIYTILALAPGGAAWFIVEKDAKGFAAEKPEDKHGIRSSHTAALVLDDVYVPKDQLVGGREGLGLQQAQAVFGYTRLMVAALGLGAGWRALEIAARYSRERVVSGSALAQKQGYTHKLLAPFAARLEACRAYIEEVAERLDAGEEGLQTEGAIAKFLSTETGNAAADAGIQALGGYGYTREFEVEKIKRDVRITTIYEGTSEIMEWTIARDRWQLHLKTAGAYYRDLARQMLSLHDASPDVGAGVISIGLNALAAILEACRVQKLTRSQHILFRMGELISWAETAMVFCKRAAAADYSETVRFDRAVWQAMARMHARDAALKIASDGIRYIIGAGSGAAGQLVAELGLPHILQWNQGLLADMDLVAAAITDPGAF